MKRLPWRCWFVALACMLGLMPAEAQTKADPAALIQDRLDALRVAYETEDIDKFTACFSTAQFKGFDELKAQVVQDWQQFDFKISVSTPPAFSIGLDTATATTTTVMTLRMPEGKVIDLLLVTRFTLALISEHWLILEREFLSQIPLSTD